MDQQAEDMDQQAECMNPNCQKIKADFDEMKRSQSAQRPSTPIQSNFLGVMVNSIVAALTPRSRELESLRKKNEELIQRWK